MSSQPSIFRVFLIKPSKYDDQGYVMRHWRGVLPSNTLACLHGLTEEVRRRRLLRMVDLRVQTFDEAVDKLPLGKIARINRRKNEKVVVCLVGVQSNQFCRASDIALELRKDGVQVLIGGFHVSGVMALFPEISPEIQRLLDAGVTVVAGEVEHRWDQLLRDAFIDELQPIYRFLNDLPDLFEAPRPLINTAYLRKFLSSNFGTVDCSRGCPFNCSFCTIINVQGRKSRHRSPECIAETLRQNYLEHGIDFYFFTDDDFARNPSWEEVFDRLIKLKEEEGVPVTFMIQVDTLSYKIPRFVEKAACAGCSNVFIGMESINPRNLKDVGKTQNHVKQYRELIDAWHAAKVSTHVGYIIGFPKDTEESIHEDVVGLMSEVRPQRASFFMMTPLPGSRDHKAMVEAGTKLDPDFNTYDSFHESLPHPLMKNGAWTRAYKKAWRTFYSFDNMREILSNADPKNYWGILRNFYWYKNSALNEGTHPMIAGFFRLKDRRTRRPGYTREGWLAHAFRRAPEIYRYCRDTIRLTLEMEELWLQTRRRSETENRVVEELGRMRNELRRSLRVSELQTAFARTRTRTPSLEVPSRLSLAREKLSVLRVSRLRETRRDLENYWASFHERLRHGRVWVLLRVDRIGLNMLREIRLAAGFLIALFAGPQYGAQGS